MVSNGHHNSSQKKQYNIQSGASLKNSVVSFQDEQCNNHRQKDREDKENNKKV